MNACPELNYYDFFKHNTILCKPKHTENRTRRMLTRAPVSMRAGFPRGTPNDPPISQSQGKRHLDKTHSSFFKHLVLVIVSFIAGVVCGVSCFNISTTASAAALGLGLTCATIASLAIVVSQTFWRTALCSNHTHTQPLVDRLAPKDRNACRSL